MQRKAEARSQKENQKRKSAEAVSTQHSAFSPRNCLVLFQLASFPAMLQKAKEARRQPYHRLKFNRIEQRVTLLARNSGAGSRKGKAKPKTRNPRRQVTDF
jgi:hypothetical protein